MEVLPELLHVLQVGILAQALGSSLLLLLLLGLLPLLAGTSAALLLLPLSYLSSGSFGDWRVHVVCWAGDLNRHVPVSHVDHSTELNNDEDENRNEAQAGHLSHSMCNKRHRKTHVGQSSIQHVIPDDFRGCGRRTLL